MSFQSPSTPESPFSHEKIELFHSALLSSFQSNPEKLSSRLDQIVVSREFRALLHSIETFSQTEGISFSESAIHLIRAFRELDSTWETLLIQEGIEKLRSSGFSVTSG